jgi:hypothetical protein
MYTTLSDEIILPPTRVTYIDSDNDEDDETYEPRDDSDDEEWEPPQQEKDKDSDTVSDDDEEEEWDVSDAGGNKNTVSSRDVTRQLKSGAFFDKPMKEACRLLGCGQTRLKHIMRSLGYKKWPYRHNHSLKTLRAFVEKDSTLNASQKAAFLASIKNSAENKPLADKSLRKLRQHYWKARFQQRQRNY